MRYKRAEILSIALATIIVFSALMVTVPTYANAAEAAIDDGMAWLAAQQNADGSWGTSEQVARTAFAVLKFETHAIENNIDPLHPSYAYSSNVSKGLDYIFNNSYAIPIGPQTHGDPDGDNDGIGVGFWTIGSRIYNTGIAMMAIAASTHPGKVVTVPPGPTCAVSGWLYRDVLQDALDYMAFGQVDKGTGRGGWDYSACDNGTYSSDNSNTGYAVLGLGYAQAIPPGGFGLTIPEFVKDELDVWIEYIQNQDNVTMNTPDPIGGSGYTRPDHWVNMLKTGNLLYEMWFVGDKVTTPRVKAAIAYLVRHWNDTDYIGWKGPGPGGNPAWPPCYQTMYCIMKGLEAFGIEKIDGFDWQADFETALIAQQYANGSWPNAPFFGDTIGGPFSLPGGWAWDTDHIISTEWALLTLEKAVPPPPTPGIPEVKEELEAIEEKLDKYLPWIKNETMMIEWKLHDIKLELEDIEWKLHDIKKEVSDIWTYLTINITSMLVSIKDEITTIEEKLDFLVDKETVEVQIVRVSPKKHLYMLTTVGGQKCNITSITIHAKDKELQPPDYTITCIFTGFYKIEFQRKAIGTGVVPIVIQVECVQNDVTYYGAALTSIPVDG